MTDTQRDNNGPAPALPYALPAGWGLKRVRFGGWVVRLLWLAVAAVFGYFLVTGFGQHGWSGDIWLLFGVVFGVGAAAEVGTLAGGQRKPPEFINAVTLMQGDLRIADDWAHFFRNRRFQGSGIVFGWAAGLIGTLGSVAVLLAAWLGRGEFAVGALVLLGLSLLWLSVISEFSVHWFRDRSFGRIPFGLALTRHGIAHRTADTFAHIEWQHIKGIAVSAAGLSEKVPGGTMGAATTKWREPRGYFVSVLSIHSDAQTEIEDELDPWFRNRLDGYAQQPWLIYTAVQFYWAHPELRDELGTTLAQRRMERWNDAIVQMIVERR